MANLKAVIQQTKIIGKARKRIRINKKRGLFQYDVTFTLPTAASLEAALRERIQPAMEVLAWTIVETAKDLMRNTRRRSGRPSRPVARVRSAKERNAMMKAIKRRPGAPSAKNYPPAVQSGNLVNNLIAVHMGADEFQIQLGNATYGSFHESGYEGGKRSFIAPAIDIVANDPSALARAFRGVF